MYCAHCGKQIPDEALFCQHCGCKCAQIPKDITEEKMAQPQSQPEIPREIPLPSVQKVGRYAMSPGETLFSSQSAGRMTEMSDVLYKANKFDSLLTANVNNKKKLPKWVWITICTIVAVFFGV